MRVALVYDRVNTWGGAERVLLALHELWPQAPLYTSVYEPSLAPWARVFDVRTSFMQHIPLASRNHELFPWLTPIAFESFSFDAFDLVVSVTSAEAKGIITKPETLHVCYCLTPTRYLWSGYSQYQREPGMGSAGFIVRYMHSVAAPTLKRWDTIASSRPDYYIAISESVEKRVKKFYRQSVQSVIYPPVDLDTFRMPSPDGGNRENYYLVVSRLVAYKRIDVIIRAFNRLRLPLVIIGQGREREALMRIAGPSIRFLDGYLTDSELAAYYQNCRGFVTMADEDFGIATVEALASGSPVIGLNRGGTAEIVKNGETGLLVESQTEEALALALGRFEQVTFHRNTCRKSARRFDKHHFMTHMKQTLTSLLQSSV